MFTGIIEATATVSNIVPTAPLMQLTLTLPVSQINPLKIGASIAVNGTCLTVTKINHQQIFFDVMQETLRCTNLGTLKIGDKVNIERAAKFGDEIGGHLLSGHIASTAELIAIKANTFRFQGRPSLIPYLFNKGYIALNGVSLTLGQINDTVFEIYLIPETLRATTFSELQVGDKVNVEIDHQTQVIVETLKKMTRQTDS